jgi:hypothetical protein
VKCGKCKDAKNFHYFKCGAHGHKKKIACCPKSPPCKCPKGTEALPRSICPAKTCNQKGGVWAKVLDCSGKGEIICCDFRDKCKCPKGTEALPIPPNFPTTCELEKGGKIVKVLADCPGDGKNVVCCGVPKFQ